MSSLFDTIFGSTDDSAQKEQLEQNRNAVQLIAKNTERARDDILRIFPQASEAAKLGFQGALDVTAQAAPQQFGAFQGGNVAAQETLLAGLSQAQNAILGLPQDSSGLQTTQLPIDTRFTQQQVPRAAEPTAANPLTPQQVQAIKDSIPSDIGSFGGFRGF